MTEAAKKVTKPAKPAEHPKYSEMILSALTALKDRTGSSRQAIEKYIKANYKVGDNASIQIRKALRRMDEIGAILHPKGKGASGSFKLNKAVKEAKPKKKVVKKPAAKKAVKIPAAKKTTKKPVGGKKPKSPKKTPKKATEKTAEDKSKAKKTTAKTKPANKAGSKKTAKKTATKKGAKPAAKKAAKSPMKK